MWDTDISAIHGVGATSSYIVNLTIEEYVIL